MKSPDFNDFTVGNEKKKDTPTKPKILPGANRWWLANDKDLPTAVMSQVASIIQADRGRIDSYNTYAKLYGSYTPTFWNGYGLANSGRNTGPAKDRLTYNIIQSCIDSLTSTVTTNKPKPMFLTSDGNSNLQRRAQKLDKFCYGIFYQNGAYKMGPKRFRDKCVFGDGITHIYAEEGQIKFERVLPYEILVDYLESHYGPESTLSMHRIKNIDRTQLIEMFPEHRDMIAIMPGTASYLSASNQSVADTVTVVESWRLPVGSKKGVHSIIAPGITLIREDYEDDFFPFVVEGYNPRLYGYFSQSMAEQLVPIQVEINRTLISIQRSLYLGGTHKIFVKAGSKVIKSHFDNLVGTILEYAGDTAPQYVVPQLVQPEIYNHLQSMIGMGYQQPGISQMGATSMKTPGVNSGRAMRTEQNISTQRHETVNQDYQDSYVQAAKIVVSVARKAYTQTKDGLLVKVPGKRFIETIDWKDVDLKNDEFSLQLYPVSKLPQDPEGRIATITEMMQGGLMDPRVGRRLLDFPDLDAEESLANATQDYLHKILGNIVDHGDYVGPEPEDDLTMAKTLVMEYIAKGKLNNLSDDKLEMLRDFNKQIGILTAPPAPEPQMGAQPLQPVPLTPPANPEATPTSELIPNINT